MTWNFHQNQSPKKQEQGAVPVNDRSKMTAESASTQGKDSTPALQKAWVLHTNNVWHARDRFRSFAKHGCLHTHDVRYTRDIFRSFAKHGCLHTHDIWRARVLQWEYGCVHTHDILRVLYSFVVCLLLCLFIQTHQLWWARVSILHWQSQRIS